MTAARNEAVERAVELVTASFGEDVELTVELLLDIQSRADMAYTLAASSRLVKVMIDRLAHETGDDPVELWQQFSREAVERHLRDDDL